jgi:hypothetical protein
VKQTFDDRNIRRIFSNLKHIENDYPARMMRLRRNRYIRQAAAMTVILRTAGDRTGGIVQNNPDKAASRSKRLPR